LTGPSAGATNDRLGVSDHSVSESYPAQPDAVPQARTQIGDFALAGGVAGEALHAIRLAVSEAVTNAVRHAYRGRSGRVYVTAALVPGEFVMLVSDDGCGYRTPAENPGFGWGLAVIADATDDFVITERGGGGTEVRMRFRLAETEEPESQDRGSIDSVTTPA
jgi:anti-sigma regulatory factor (Ser/Thr protein kinase)